MPEGNTGLVLRTPISKLIIRDSACLEHSVLSPQDALPKREVDFVKLDSGALVETIEDPADPSRTTLVVFENGNVHLERSLEHKGRLLVPISRNAIGFSHVKLPSGVLPYTSAYNLLNLIAARIGEVIDITPEYAFLIAAFVLYTALADRLPTAVYLCLVGLPQSGKSTLLELFHLLCRRPLLASDISRTALYRTCSRFQATLLIDEMDWNSPRTGLQHLLRAGSSGSAQILRAGETGTSFGPKVFTSLEPLSDPALKSRSIEILMRETKRNNLMKTSDPRVTAFAAAIRKQLLQFRLDHYESVRLITVPGSEVLRPRSQDLLASLAAVCQNKHAIDQLLKIFTLYHDPSTREPLPYRHSALIGIIFELIHTAATAEVRLGGKHGLSAAVNDRLLTAGERAKVSDREIGHLLASLGFRSKKRTSAGWVLLLDRDTRERCHHLITTHGGYSNQEFLEQCLKNCPECKASTEPPKTPADSSANAQSLLTQRWRIGLEDK